MLTRGAETRTAVKKYGRKTGNVQTETDEKNDENDQLQVTCGQTQQVSE